MNSTAEIPLCMNFHQNLPPVQESYNTPLEHTPGNPLANYERNPFIACW